MKWVRILATLALLPVLILAIILSVMAFAVWLCVLPWFFWMAKNASVNVTTATDSARQIAVHRN